MKKEKPTYTTVHWKSLDDPDKFRDADRIEEAQKIPLTESQQTLLEQENKELKEDQQKNKMDSDYHKLLTDAAKASKEGEEQDNPTLWQIATTHNVSYADAVPIQEEMRLKKDALKEACTIAEMRKDRTPLAAMKKRAQEAEGELSIMKGLETNRVKEAQARCDQLQDELDRVKKENNDLYNRLDKSLKDLAQEKEDHQYDNLVHGKEVERRNK